ncbi:potassium channel family protein [Desulfobacter curvatus]|uniref:potassium channel family protein n=1 Tax=Desulfobacter curvatus TaxID=2290 RepID=UPI000475DC26|nr:potassium channel protein [Desulfobacter curvatus]
MDKTSKMKMTVFIAVLFFILGTTGYMAIEGWGLLDAAYMTAITLSTVGFLEVHDLSDGGRLFTIFLIFTGVGYFLYLGGVFISSVVDGEIKSMLGRQRLNSKIKKMDDHFIVCGYGRIGRVLCKFVREDTQDIVVVEQSEGLKDILEKDKIHYIIGDAGDEEVLEKAGIKRARALVAALATDAANVFLVLTARQLNPDIYIMARAVDPKVRKKLYVAGANQVESPYDTGGVSMGLKLLRPTVSSFLNTALSRESDAIQIEEAFVPETSDYAGKPLKDSGIRQNFNLIIIAIKEKSGHMEFAPHFETIIHPRDTLIVMGKTEDLKAFRLALGNI